MGLDRFIGLKHGKVSAKRQCTIPHEYMRIIGETDVILGRNYTKGYEFTSFGVLNRLDTTSPKHMFYDEFSLDDQNRVILPKSIFGEVRDVLISGLGQSFVIQPIQYGIERLLQLAKKERLDNMQILSILENLDIEDKYLIPFKIAS